jgi:large subunit ribosomal protein L34
VLDSSILIGEADPASNQSPRSSTVMALHYPRKTSRIKKVRKMGFRARMATKGGRKIINGRRRAGRKRLTTI